MILWWKTALAVALLSFHECFAKKSHLTSVSKRSRSVKASNARTADSGRRTLRHHYDDEEDDEEEEDSLDRWSSYGDELLDERDSQEDGGGNGGASDPAQDRRVARGDRRRRPTLRQERPSTSTPSAGLGYVDVDEQEGVEDDIDDDDLDADFWEEPTLSRSDGKEEDDFDDSDDYDEYEHEYGLGVPPRRGGPRGSKQDDMRPSAWTGNDVPSGDRRRSSGRAGVLPRRGSSRGSVAKYQRGRRAATRRGFSVRMPAVSGVAIASALRRQMGAARGAVAQAGSLAASTSKRLKREVKVVVSGSWESALLKVTWPDDLPPDDALVLEGFFSAHAQPTPPPEDLAATDETKAVDTLVEAVKAFKLDRDVTKNSAEHRVLLRKLWTKMSETDWRTVAKAVYMFHTILQEISPEQHAVLKIFLGKMSREPDNRTGGHYFDLDVLCGVSGEGEAFQSFLDRYGSYVFRRAADFNARFQELDSMRADEDWECAVTMLVNAQKAIDLGVSCRPEPEEETELTVLCLRNTAYDTCQLWRRFHSALAWVLEEAESGDLFEGADAEVVGDCLEEFKGFYSTRYKEVVAFLADAEELLDIYGVDVPELDLPLPHDFLSARSADDDGMEMGYDNEHDDDPSARRRDVTTRRPAPAAGADADLGGAGKRPTKAHRASKRSPSGTLDTRTAGRGGGLGGDLDASGAAGAIPVEEITEGCVSVRDDEEEGGEEEEGEEEEGEEVRDRSEEMLGSAVCEAGGAGEKEATGGAVRKREGGADNTVLSISAPQVELDREKDEDVEEEEDSEEEGAVDEHVDDLTFFDDATQPDGTDPE